MADKMREALEKARDWIDAQGCRHESTHRGGAIWTICDDCGTKWADDEGGFQPYRPPAILKVIDAALAAPVPPAEAVEMSPEFTDTSRAALLWVLWHHQGGSSPVGQPLRFALGMGAHDRLNERQVAEAKRWAALTKSTTADFHAAAPQAPAEAVPPPYRQRCAQCRSTGYVYGCLACAPPTVAAPAVLAPGQDIKELWQWDGSAAPQPSARTEEMR